MTGLNVEECPACHRSVVDPDALFCAGCGAPLGPPRTIDLDGPPPAAPPSTPPLPFPESSPPGAAPPAPPPPEPPPGPPPPPAPVAAPASPVEAPQPQLEAPAHAAVAVAEPIAAPPAPDPSLVHNRKAAYIGLTGAALAIIGAFQTWLRIRIGGFIPPGSAQTGWRGGDGRTIVVAAGVGALAALVLWIGRRELWLKIALLISGAVTVVIAIVHMADAGSKAHDIEVQFGIPAEDVRAQVGVGLYLVVLGGLGLLVAGLQAKTSS